MDKIPQVLKRVGDQCVGSEISPSGRWAIAHCGGGIRIFDLNSTDEKIKPHDIDSSALPRDVFSDPEARWLMEKDAIIGPSFEAALDMKPARDPAGQKKKFQQQIRASQSPEAVILRGLDAGGTYVHSPDWRWIVRDNQLSTEVSKRMDQQNVSSRAWTLYDTQRPANHKVVLEFSAETTFLGFSNGSRWLVTGTADRRIQVYDLNGELQLASGKPLGESEWEDSPEIIFSPDDQWMIGSLKGDVRRIWRVGSSESVTLGEVATGGGSEVVFSPDSKYLALQNASNDEVTFWKLDLINQEWKRFDPVGTRVGVSEIKFSRDSHWLVVSGNFGARLRDLTNQDDLPNFDSLAVASNNSAQSAVTVDFSPDSAWLVTRQTAQNHSEYALWDLKDNYGPLTPMRLNGIELAKPVFSADSHWLMFIGNVSRIYNLRNILPTWEGTSDKQWSESVLSKLSPNQRWKITMNAREPVLLWDLHANPIDSDPFVLSGSLFGRDIGRQEFSRRTCDIFSGDSRWLVTHSEKNRAFLWDLKDSTQPRQGFEFQTLARTVAFSPAGSFMISSPDPATVRVWQLDVSAIGKSFIDIRLRQSPSLSFLFSSDERWLLAKTENGEASLFRPEKPRRTLTTGHDRHVGVNWGRICWKWHLVSYQRRKCSPPATETAG